jgi:hypothetical protein
MPVKLLPPPPHIEPAFSPFRSSMVSPMTKLKEERRNVPSAFIVRSTLRGNYMESVLHMCLLHQKLLGIFLEMED